MNLPPRLLRVFRYLQDGEWHTTPDIQNRAYVTCAPNAISELREKSLYYGFTIQDQRVEGKSYKEYRLIEKGQRELI